jgi:hypothetical protein
VLWRLSGLNLGDSKVEAPRGRPDAASAEQEYR